MNSTNKDVLCTCEADLAMYDRWVGGDPGGEDAGIAGGVATEARWRASRRSASNGATCQITCVTSVVANIPSNFRHTSVVGDSFSKTPEIPTIIHGN